MLKQWLIRTISLVIILAACYCSGCGDDDAITNNPGNTGTVLSGNILNYPGGSLIAKAVIFKFTPPIDSFFPGIDTIENDGALHMTLSTPPMEFLRPFDVDTLINISDTSARVAYINNLTAYDFSGIKLAKISKQNYNDTAIIVGSFLVNYIYATKPVILSGYDTTLLFGDTMVAKFNLSLAAGWNVVNLRITIKRDNFLQYDYSTGEPSGGSWRYQPIASAILNPFQEFIR